MALDALNIIKKAESDARLLAAKAKEDTDKLIAENKQKCRELIARKTKEAHKEAEMIFIDEAKAAQREIKLLSDEFNCNLETLQLIIKRNTDKAAEAVINYFLSKEA